jgi:hypothetical protein
MSTKIRVPEGWSSQAENFSVKLKPGKPKDATTWVDVQGRPVVKNGRTWSLQKRPAPAPRKLTSQETQQKGGGQKAQAPQPNTDSGKTQNLTPEEQKYYNRLADIAKEKINDGITAFYDDYDDPEEALEAGKRKFAPYTALSDNQLSAIGAYTTKWYRNMNSLLRKGEISLSRLQQLHPEENPAPSEAQVRKAIGDFTSALEQLPKAPRGIFSRAVSSTSDSIKQLHTLEEGDTIEDPGFSSFTTSGASVLDTFFKGEKNSDQNILFEVESDQMRNIAPISKFDEEEHVLAPGAKFKVVGKQTGHSKIAGKHLVIKLQQITT